VHILFAYHRPPGGGSGGGRLVASTRKRTSPLSLCARWTVVIAALIERRGGGGSSPHRTDPARARQLHVRHGVTPQALPHARGILAPLWQAPYVKRPPLSPSACHEPARHRSPARGRPGKEYSTSRPLTQIGDISLHAQESRAATATADKASYASPGKYDTVSHSATATARLRVSRKPAWCRDPS